MQHLFFINENSLRGRIGKCVQEISAVCDEHGLTHQIIITKSIAELREQVSRWGKGDRAGVGQRGDGAGAGLVWDREGTGLVQGWCGTERGRGWCPIFQRSRKWDTSPVPSLSHTSPFVPHCLLCVGGDGTLQALINAVDLTSAVIQYLPYGSGNNAYRTFYNQPFDLRRDILSNNTFTADLGCANGEYFATMLGLALDSSIGNNLAKFKWLPLPGKTKYLASALFSLLFCNEPVRLKMTVNGRTEQLTTSFVSITNGPTIGGQTPMQPYASAFDGRLNALVAQRLTPTAALRLFSQVKKGEHLHDPLVSHFEFEELLFESAENLMYEVDGEIRSASRIRVEVYAILEPARRGARTFSRRLKDDGHRVLIITKRVFACKRGFLGVLMRGIVRFWLWRNGISCDQLVFCENDISYSKASACLELDIDVMIDDEPVNVLAIAPIATVICYDASYNAACEGAGILRARDFGEAAELIESLRYNKRA